MSNASYNQFPPNWHKISEEEFAQSSFFTYNPASVEHRQMYPEGQAAKVAPVSARLYWMADRSGFALVSDYWGGKVQFFAFHECDHEYTSQNLGNCWHLLTCSKCGFVREIDSSD